LDWVLVHAASVKEALACWQEEQSIVLRVSLSRAACGTPTWTPHTGATA